MEPVEQLELDVDWEQFRAFGLTPEEAKALEPPF